MKTAFWEIKDHTDDLKKNSIAQLIIGQQ